MDVNTKISIKNESNVKNKDDDAIKTWSFSLQLLNSMESNQVFLNG